MTSMIFWLSPNWSLTRSESSGIWRKVNLANTLKFDTMQNIETWEQFLARHSKEAKPAVDWDQRKQEWLGAINRLFGKIEDWFAQELREKQLKIENDQVSLSEEYLGSYVAPSMHIYIGDQPISLIPRGALILGAFGRIDIRGTKGEVILIRDKADQWSLAQQGPGKVRRTELTESSFKEVLQQLI